MDSDFIVIGAGIAGASVAALLAAEARVILLEREDHPGFHSTGRSAALFSEIYGNETVRALSRASRPFFLDPPQDFSETDLVRQRGSLFLASAAQLEQLDAFAALPDIAPVTRRLSGEQLTELCPQIRADFVVAGVLEPQSMDIEVHELHQGYLRLFRRRGGTLITEAPVDAMVREDGGWRVAAGSRRLRAPVVINAAGAWADAVAALAGVAPIGLQPYRRTAVLVDPPQGAATDKWPMMIDIDEEFYVKPDAGLLLVSPADETPSDPCDAQPDELDIATAIYRAEEALKLDVRRTKRSWAGLRSFVADRTPVVGFDPEAEGFFWLAGQGGYGIQTAPALARAAAALAQHGDLPPDLLAQGVRQADLAPDRLRRN
ncbi:MULTISPECIES: NAD(P)/FAD-dependent oxidoreductase [unclassified Sphingomonas]|uniref:NAD(P)/FAD-dependent oxidoreductase n=1 Tax=unclassified Sphingomonas TaxID=196159 RepID=UPI0006FCCFA7|nr:MULTISPECIES: FAD-binding oxidoreductase [unclassified Sphingomonas]KQX26013.1 FAD-dependent oxidoreductase [Sphingomonas sp. Root1294]KQY69079.1 FAD-dependent oxidoreductase [Sphingomonas sp. Root50]KRB89333.1 FAD-dependent oxidoreductase [Sphingomonas sp. Root720]